MAYYRAVQLTLPIREVQRATPRARIVRLDLNGHAFDYLAGQAILVGAQGGTNRRPYSIAAAPEDARRDSSLELLVGVEADGQAGDHLALDVGAQVDIEGPVGSFTFPSAPDEKRFVFIAGGTGIAPLRAMLRHALAIRHRGIGLFYSARTPEDFAFEAELRALAQDGDIELRQTVTRAAAPMWTGTRGRFDRAILGELVHDPATLCFVCGPPALVSEMPSILRDLGVPPERIRIDAWT
jgi:ferredoxin-NADP reductase